MALRFESAVNPLSELDLWYKIKVGQSLMLSDVPEIIRLRWPYFRDNWGFIRERYLERISDYEESNLFKNTIDRFTQFIESQRVLKARANPFDNSDVIFRFYAIFDNTPISSLQTTKQEQDIITEKVNRIKMYTRGDFLKTRGELEKERDLIADQVSLTDETYNRIFDRSPATATLNPRNKDMNNMFEIQQAIRYVDFILANAFSLEQNVVDPFALARANAQNPEIDIRSYLSGSLEKLNYGEDLKSLATRTLGDPNRWLDIAITNGLKAPYIDEVGERVFLLSNASANLVNLPELDSAGLLNADKLYVGQIVLLQSNSQTFPEQRVILSIKPIPVSGELVIELDGESDLERYRADEDAYIRLFKPNTTNSGFLIMIPSDTPIDDRVKSEEPWFLRSSGTVEKNQKVDIAINDSGDLSLSPNGDLQLSFGLVNSAQAIRLKMSTEEGELIRHPDFGLVQIQGSKNDDVESVRSALSNSISKLIEADERFSGISTLDISYGGNNASTINISLIVRLAGANQLLPINFSINNS